MTKRERLFALVAERAQLETRIKDVDAEIDELFGEGTTRPGRRPQRRKEATTTQPREPGAGGEPPIPPATNGSGRPVSEESLRVIALAKGGMTATQVAAELGWKGRAGMVKATNVIYRARKAGTLPKAEASR